MAMAETTKGVMLSPRASKKTKQAVNHVLGSLRTSTATTRGEMLSGGASCFAKLAADLEYNDDEGVTARVYTDPTTTGQTIDNVLPPPWLTEGKIKRYSWVELKKWGEKWYAFPLPVAQDVLVDQQVDGENSELEHKKQKIFVPAVGDESDWHAWHTGEACS